MIWRSYKIWLPVFVICVVLSFSLKYAVSPPPMMIGSEEEQLALKERTFKHFSQGKEPPIIPTPTPPPKTDYAGVGLKIGSGIGGVMSLISFIEKLIKWFRKEKKVAVDV